MSYLKSHILRSKSALYRAQKNNTQILKEAAIASMRKEIFLSHSHDDKELAEGLQFIFEEIGIPLYLDWQDTSMPPNANRETAEKLKDKINSHKYFLVLATENALESRWVPWEIGVADQLKSLANIALLPIAKYDGGWNGNEYLQLYSRIEIATDYSLIKIEPNQRTGQSIHSWLK